jgi:hypothetical protein
MLSLEEMIAGLNTIAKIRSALEVLNKTPSFQIVGHMLKTIVRKDIYPAYSETTPENQKRIEDIAVGFAVAEAPKPVVAEVPKPVVTEAQKPEDVIPENSPLYVMKNLENFGTLKINNLDPNLIDEKFEFKEQKMNLLMGIIYFITTTRRSVDSVKLKDFEDLLKNTRPNFQQVIGGNTLEDYILSADIRHIDDKNHIELLKSMIVILLKAGLPFPDVRKASASMKPLLESIPRPRNIFLSKTPSSPCQYVKDWESGELEGVVLPHGIKPDYFYCGNYYFDGKFVVVKFPKGMSLYHGSKPLANAAVNMPLGPGFYIPQVFGEGKKYPEVSIRSAESSEFTVEELLTEKSMITESWYTNPVNAKSYSSGCCVQSYKLKRDSVFFLLDNDINLLTLINDKTIDPYIIEKLRDMFNLYFRNGSEDDKKVNFGTMETAEDPFRAISGLSSKRGAKVFNKKRISDFDTDKTFASWFCSYFNDYGYAGYCSPTQYIKTPDKPSTAFHLEFMYCNAPVYLERDLRNPIDIFYEDPDAFPDTVKTLVNQMKYYETTNTNFHSGNLLQHSVWCLLFAESLIGKLVNLKNPSVEALDEKTRSIIIAAALLHDIGKMNPSMCSKNMNTRKFVYYAIESHPSIGAEYFNSGIPLVNDELETVGALYPQDILREMVPGITEDEIGIVKDVVRFHWDLGSTVLANRQTDYYKDGITTYIKLFEKSSNKLLSILATMIVSISDIQASQPYTAGKLEGMSPEEIKTLIRSRVFNYMVTKPKIFRGGNIATKLKVETSGIEAMNDILAAL